MSSQKGQCTHLNYYFRSPANGPYNQFDVPHEEQDIITEEERQDVVPRTIQDVMKDVIVYVEARFGDDNRTASIKGAMAELGATVNDNFNKLVLFIFCKMFTLCNRFVLSEIPHM